MTDNINKPNHYNQGDIDLIESWYRTYPWEQFVAIMESHIDKYIKRHRFKDNTLQDLDKAMVFLKRLREYTACEENKGVNNGKFVGIRVFDEESTRKLPLTKETSWGVSGQLMEG